MKKLNFIVATASILWISSAAPSFALPWIEQKIKTMGVIFGIATAIFTMYSLYPGPCIIATVGIIGAFVAIYVVSNMAPQSTASASKTNIAPNLSVDAESGIETSDED